MPLYNYIAIDSNGKKVKRSVEASSPEMAKSSLRGIGYTILQLEEQSGLNRDIDLPFLGLPKANDMAVFCRQFVSIIRAGVPISTVLSMLGQQTQNKKLAAAIRHMEVDIEKGATLAGSMRRHPRIFNNMLVNMVSAGEESGNLEDSFHQMEIYFDKSRRTKGAVKKAMAYPCILIVVMIVVLVVMMTNIIPKFMTAFADMGAELPLPTRMVMAVSDWFVAWWWLIIGGGVLLIVGGFAYNRTNSGKHFFGFLTRKIPVVKKLTVNSACAGFCRTLSLLLASGLALTDSLEMCANNMSNIYFKEALVRVRIMVTEGWQLNAALRETKLFPPLVPNMAGIGEESGDLQNMLSKTADYYDDEVEQATQSLLSMMEPAIILVMAVFVVILVLSIFLPMLNMTSMYDQYL